MNQQFLSIYIHYPFCKSKCPYCDFNSHVNNNIDLATFLQAYLDEIDYFASKVKNRKIKTIFFGGGTPSLMPIDFVATILSHISQKFSVASNCEITLEANPTSFEGAKFQGFRQAGVNRLSIGVQALNDKDLKFLGREHNATEAMKVIENAAKIFDNFSFDLIYTRPKQRLEDWASELKLALSFNTKHLSLYQLTIEKGTQFFSDFHKKKFIMPNDELSAQFYELTNEILEKNNFINYEISNYSRKNYECKHNLVYWQGLDYIGIGAGAHSRVYFDDKKNRQAIMMIHEPILWLKKVQENKNGIQKIDEILPHELAEELILMGLRLKDGIDNDIFIKHFGKNFNKIIDLKKLQKLVDEGMISLDKNSIKITDKGKILTNLIVSKVCEALI